MLGKRSWDRIPWCAKKILTSSTFCPGSLVPVPKPGQKGGWQPGQQAICVVVISRSPARSSARGAFAATSDRGEVTATRGGGTPRPLRFNVSPLPSRPSPPYHARFGLLRRGARRRCVRRRGRWEGRCARRVCALAMGCQGLGGGVPPSHLGFWG